MRIIEPFILPLLPSNGSLASNLVSTALDIDSMLGYAVQAVWTGSPVGTLNIQASLDKITWSDVTNSSVSLAGSAGSWLWNFQGSFYRYIRINYVSTSGTGTLSDLVMAKGY